MTRTRAATRVVHDATYAPWNAHDPGAGAAVFAKDAVPRLRSTDMTARGVA